MRIDNPRPRSRSSADTEERLNRFAFAVGGDVEGALLDFMAVSGRYPCLEDGGVQIGNGNRILDRQAGPLVGGLAIQVALFRCRRQTSAHCCPGKVPMQSVLFHFVHHVGLRPRLIAGRAAGHAFDHHVAAELAGQHDQRAIQQAALLPDRESTGRSADRFPASCAPRSCVRFRACPRLTNGTYSVVTSMNRAPASVNRRANKQPWPKRPGIVLVETLVAARGSSRTLFVPANSAADRRSPWTASSTPGGSRWRLRRCR